MGNFGKQSMIFRQILNCMTIENGSKVFNGHPAVFIEDCVNFFSV